MADIYVDSNATGAGDGSTWNDAYTTLAGAAAVDNAGDIIWVASDHSESTASALSFSWAGTAASPTRIISADKTSGTPPSTIQTGAYVETTGNSAITVASAGYIYVYGLTFATSVGGGTGDLTLVTSALAVFESCNFYEDGNNSSQDFLVGANSSSAAVLIDCNWRFSNSSNIMLRPGSAQRVIVRGGSIASGGTAPSNYLILPSDGCSIDVSGFDFSNADSGINLSNTNQQNILVTFRNCKAPSSWSGSLNGLTASANTVIEVMNLDDGDTNYTYQKHTQFGDIVQETTLVKDSGASDGTTQISWKMTTNADAEFSHQTLESGEIVEWNDTTGSSVTATIDILHDSATNLQDDEIWLEVQYLGTSGYPLSLFANDAASDYVATPADQASSSATWTTTGMSNPNKQKLSVTFTPQEKGFLIAKVRLAKASYTIYVDPLLQVS